MLIDSQGQYGKKEAPFEFDVKIDFFGLKAFLGIVHEKKIGVQFFNRHDLPHFWAQNTRNGMANK